MSWIATWWGTAAAWIIAALVLALAELIAPGFFLVFLAIGAAATSLVALVAPAPLLAQVVIFAVFTGGAVALGRRAYQRQSRSSDPLLNDRSARLIGRIVPVSEAIRAGEGRVTIGDGEWTARGPDLPEGAAARIVAVSGTAVEIEPY